MQLLGIGSVFGSELVAKPNYQINKMWLPRQIIR